MPLLEACNLPRLESIFCREIKFIMETIVEDSNWSSLKDHLILKTACFEFMDVLYSRIDHRLVHSETGSIARSFIGYKGKEGKLSKIFMNYSNKAVKECSSADESDAIKEARLAYHQAAYAAMASFLHCVASEIKPLVL